MRSNDCQTWKIWAFDGFSLSDTYMYRALRLIEFNNKKKKKKVPYLPRLGLAFSISED